MPISPKTSVAPPMRPQLTLVPTDPLAWLHNWYTRQCDGVWEHAAGLRLERVPSRGRRPAGLCLTVELVGTPGWFRAAGRHTQPPRTLSLCSLSGAWLTCTLTPERFSGSADGDRLEEIIAVLREWLEPDSAPR